MFTLVTRVLEDSEEEESSGDRGIEHAQKDQGRDHEREGHLFVRVLQGAERRSGHVLISGVCIHDGTDNAEYEDLGNGASPKCLGEISVLY